MLGVSAPPPSRWNEAAWPTSHMFDDCLRWWLGSGVHDAQSIPNTAQT